MASFFRECIKQALAGAYILLVWAAIDYVWSFLLVEPKHDSLLIVFCAAAAGASVKSSIEEFLKWLTRPTA